jgi:tetratricopeptide (TPR) repeat protein
MKLAVKLAAWAVVLSLAALACWRVVATAVSDHLAGEHPQQALEWDHNNPKALIALARRQLDHGEAHAAQETALRLLQHEPLATQGLVLLSEAIEAEGDEARMTLLSGIAIRRAPDAPGPRAWLIGDQLAQGRYSEALENLDFMLRVSPAQGARLFPILIELADDPAFADALSVELAARPDWRKSFIYVLTSKASASAVNRVMATTQHHDSLDQKEMERWIDRLVKDGKWGEAYARWVGELDGGAPSRLTGIYNGGFESRPSGIGFDWRMANSAGVIIERVAADGAGDEGSYVLKLSFLGRRMDDIPLHQWLLLAPGSYQLKFRSNAQDLRSDRGLQWVVRCQGSGAELAASDRLNGTFDWQEREVSVEVPVQGCPAQDLFLRNTGASGPGKVVLGTISFDSLSIDRVDRVP